MNEEQEALAKAYKRAAIGLAAAGALWFVAALIARRGGEDDSGWVIPVGALLLSALCYSLYRRERNSE